MEVGRFTSENAVESCSIAIWVGSQHEGTLRWRGAEVPQRVSDHDVECGCEPCGRDNTHLICLLGLVQC